jgi:hypothetical protein
VYEDIDFDFDDEDDPNPIGRNNNGDNGDEGGKGKSSKNEFALMTAPPRHVLKALDEKSRFDSSGHFIVGFDSSSGAGINPKPEHLWYKESNHGFVVKADDSRGNGLLS